MSSVIFPDGTNKLCPIDKVSLDRLLIDFKLETVVLYFLAIEYRVSPFFTV